MKVSLGFSENKDYVQAVNEAVGQATLGLEKNPPSLAIIFTTIEFAHSMVLKILNNLLGETPVIGCSSLGIISSKKIIRHGFAIALISLNPQIFFNAAFVNEVTRKTPLNAGRELGEKLLYGCRDVRRNFSLIFQDGLIADSGQLISGLEERMGRSFPLIGAAASDNLAFQKTFQYFNQDILTDSCCGILWGGKLNFGWGIEHGWKPLGKERLVTKASKNIVQEINGQAAVKLYEEYLDKNSLELSRDLKRISIFYPLGVYLAGENEYLLRNITAIKDDGALITQGDVPQGSRIRLMIGTKESCLAATAHSCEEAKKRLAGATAQFVMVFNSVSRFTLLNKQADQEIEIARQVFGPQTPLIGIYTFGEEAPLKSLNYLGKTYFHNQSVCVLAIGADK
ncbi:MAG: FIST N-terminal domain-containing protein [Candidatus Omnitrophota bacterium]